MAKWVRLGPERMIDCVAYWLEEVVLGMGVGMDRFRACLLLALSSGYPPHPDSDEASEEEARLPLLTDSADSLHDYVD